MTEEIKGLIYLLLAVTLLALSSMMVKYLYMYGVPETSLTPIFVCAGAVGTGIYTLLKKRDKLKLNWYKIKFLMIQGVIGTAMYTAFFYKSLVYIEATVAIMILYCNCIFVFIYKRFVKGVKMSKSAIFSMMIVIVGLVFSTGVFDDIAQLNVHGLLYACCASLGYAVQNINLEEKLSDMDLSVVLFYTQLIGAVCLLIVYSPTNVFDFHLTPSLFLLITVSAMLLGVLPMFLQYKGLIVVGAYKASIISTLELPITAVLAYLLISETISYTQFIGMTMIVFGSINIQRKQKLIKTIA